MKLKLQDFYWILPLSLALAAAMASLQQGTWMTGWIGFSILLIVSLALLKATHSWSGGGRILAWTIALALALRLAGGVAAHVLLPLYGYPESQDSQAGYAFTDAHRRDEQAWGLAISGKPIVDAFSRDYSSDQYGGLLALSALVYRYLSFDAHRPLMMVLLAAFAAALGVPFLWQAAGVAFGEKVAWASAWIFALYPESVLLGGSSMREPYLITLSALAFWGFVEWRSQRAAVSHRRAAGLRGTNGERTSERSASADEGRGRSAIGALGLSLIGMLLLSPAVAIYTLVIFAGWMLFSRERVTISWRSVAIFAILFLIGLLVLSSSLNRRGVFDTASPMAVVNDWLQYSVRWNVYQIERESGWVQKLFDEMPDGLRLPFVVTYGILQPVLPATLIVPTLPIWKLIYILRALGWYALLPLMILAFVTGSTSDAAQRRTLFVWLALLAWTWILLAALRGGGDQWDNPRYRTILLMWHALVAGYVWVWWRETRNTWLVRIVACEAVFVLVFTQWYASRYYYVGGQLPFPVMIALIVGLWGVIVGAGWWLDKKRGQPRAL